MRDGAEELVKTLPGKRPMFRTGREFAKRGHGLRVVFRVSPVGLDENVGVDRDHGPVDYPVSKSAAIARQIRAFRPWPGGHLRAHRRRAARQSPRGGQRARNLTMDRIQRGFSKTTALFDRVRRGKNRPTTPPRPGPGGPNRPPERSAPRRGVPRPDARPFPRSGVTRRRQHPARWSRYMRRSRLGLGLRTLAIAGQTERASSGGRAR